MHMPCEDGDVSKSQKKSLHNHDSPLSGSDDALMTISATQEVWKAIFKTSVV